MKRNEGMKLDFGTLTRLTETRWKIDGQDLTGKRRQKRFTAANLQEAIIKAESTLKMPNAGIQHPRLEIQEALTRERKTRTWGVETLKNEKNACLRFLRWIDTQELSYWHELKLEHAQAFKKYLISEGLAFDSIRLLLQPIRRTSKWAAANYPGIYHDITLTLRLNRRETVSGRKGYDESRGNPALSIGEVLDLISWIIQHPEYESLAAGIALQGIAGLSCWEAFRLTWDQVDFEAQTVTIEGETKNEYRVRRIPVSDPVAWALRHVNNQREKRCSKPVPYQDKDGYGKALRKAFKAYGINLKPKDLRNTLQTAAMEGGWYSYYVMRYVGHAPKTIGEKHYVGDTGDRLLTLFHEKVIIPMNQEIQGWIEDRGTSFFGPFMLKNVNLVGL